MDQFNGKMSFLRLKDGCLAALVLQKPVEHGAYYFRIDSDDDRKAIEEYRDIIRRKER